MEISSNRLPSYAPAAQSHGSSTRSEGNERYAAEQLRNREQQGTSADSVNRRDRISRSERSNESQFDYRQLIRQAQQAAGAGESVKASGFQHHGSGGWQAEQAINSYRETAELGNTGSGELLPRVDYYV